MNIAGKITAIREALGLNKKSFAAEIHVTPSYVTQIEKGEKIPSDSLLDLIMAKWAISVDWWEVGEGEIFSSESAITLEQKLGELGFKGKDVRQFQEWSKLSEAEQDELLKQLCMRNIEKGRY